MNTTAESQSVTRAGADALLEEVVRGEQSLTAYLPDGTSPQRFMALARRAILEQPGLAECSAASVMRALRECALSGLELDGKISTLIVRKSKQGRPMATWDVTYRGMISQALASGHVRSVEVQVVREADEFTVELGSQTMLIHRPCLTGARGEVIASYAVAELAGGARVVELLTRQDIERIRASSAAGERGAWGSWADEMARKACVRRLLKKLPAGVLRREPFATSHRIPAEPRKTPMLPEDGHALECRALEQIAGATTVDEIDMAWSQAKLSYANCDASVPLSIEARWRERREGLQAMAGI